MDVTVRRENFISINFGTILLGELKSFSFHSEILGCTVALPVTKPA